MLKTEYMKKIFLFLLLLIFTSQFSFSQAVNKRIDSLLNSIYKNDEPGIAIAIQQNGKIIFEKGYGLANLETKEKISPVSNFNTGSLTKQFTALSILQLASDNKLSLEDSLIKFFPQFNKKIGSMIT